MSEFSVCEFYDDGYHAYVERWIGAKDAVLLAAKIAKEVRHPAYKGPVTKVIITDGDDFTVFAWERGKGVTFPERSSQNSQ
jgi:hypothetical protein